MKKLAVAAAAPVALAAPAGAQNPYLPRQNNYLGTLGDRCPACVGRPDPSMQPRSYTGGGTLYRDHGGGYHINTPNGTYYHPRGDIGGGGGDYFSPSAGPAAPIGPMGYPCVWGRC
jgi:hypothetical protein